MNPDAGGKCLENSTAMEGQWGADNAIMVITTSSATIEFGCGNATVDAFTFSTPTTFNATGSYLAGSGVQPLPGHEPAPQPATFTGHLVGDTLTFEMTTAAGTQAMTFTKDRQVNLFHCL